MNPAVILTLISELRQAIIELTAENAQLKAQLEGVDNGNSE